MEKEFSRTFFKEAEKIKFKPMEMKYLFIGFPIPQEIKFMIVGRT